MKKGKLTKHECYECGNEKMRITDESEQENGVIIWFKCEKCGSLDDMILYY